MAKMILMGSQERSIPDLGLTVFRGHTFEVPVLNPRHDQIVASLLGQGFKLFDDSDVIKKQEAKKS